MTTHIAHLQSDQALKSPPIILDWHSDRALKNPPIILDWHSDRALKNPPIILDWHSDPALKNPPIILYWHSDQVLHNPPIILDWHSDQALHNPPTILEALVQGRRSIDTPYIASTEIKAQGHGIYLNKRCQQPTNNTWSPGTRQREYWHTLHRIKWNKSLRTGIYLNKGPHDAGLCECGAWHQ
jgi:hypothetical protein